MGGVRGFMVQIPGKLYHSCDSEEAENTLNDTNFGCCYTEQEQTHENGIVGVVAGWGRGTSVPCQGFIIRASI